MSKEAKLDGEHAVVLLSGGQDSTTCLGWAQRKFEGVFTFSVAYGQRHAAELESAAQVAEVFGVDHEVISLPVLSALGDSALVQPGEIKATGGYADQAAPDGLPTSFVPGRNLLFLAIAGAAAVKVGARHIVTGVCQTDYSGYPDCRTEFIESMEQTLGLAMPSSCGPFNIWTPLMHLTKAETVRMAHEDPITWEALKHTVTCYQGQKPGCGTCPACELRAKGFEEAGLADPAVAAFAPR